MSLAIFSLFLAAFSIGTSEFIVAGILPNIAGDLGVDIPTAGYLISGYAIGVAIGGPIVALITGGFERRATLLVLLSIFVAGSAFCAVAPSYGWLMVARLLLSLSHGAYFGIALIVAASLVPEEKHASAVALVIAGITVANIFGVPAGTWIGNAYGWRATFWAIAVLGGLSVAALTLWLPRSAPKHGDLAGMSHQFRMLGRQEVYLSYAMILCTTVGFFVSFSYIAPILLYTTGISVTALPWVLSLLGLGALIGITGGGRGARYSMMGVVIIVFAALIVLNAALVGVLGQALPAIVILFLWAIGNFAFSAPLQSRILKGAHEAPNLAASLISSAFNIGISAGAAIGAVALKAGMSYGQLPLIGVIAAVPTLAIAIAAHFIDRRRVRLAAPAAAA
jgi:DHA1 family inner membrane transport protein